MYVPYTCNVDFVLYIICVHVIVGLGITEGKVHLYNVLSIRIPKLLLKCAHLHSAYILHCILISTWFSLHTCRANCDVQLLPTESDVCGVDTNTNLSAICQLSRNNRISIYSATTLATIILILLRSALLYGLCLNASRVLHNRMFASVLRAPVLFFDTNPSG